MMKFQILICGISIVGLFFILCVNVLVSGHLKDMGEVKSNWNTDKIMNQMRIVGGVRTKLEQYPFLVQFFNFGGVCAGSIITSKTVLTAAHCFDFNKNIAEMRIFSKARFIFDPQADQHEVWDFVINERYNNTEMFSNDIAVILIHDSFSFNSAVQRVLFVKNDDWMNESETTFEGAGWGVTKSGETSKVGLLKVNLRYIPREKCEKQSKIFVSTGMFCLYGDGERDTCQGDSGGGILWHGFLVGIVSHGNGCAISPSMYVNVYYYKSWIFNTITALYKKNCRFHEQK